MLCCAFRFSVATKTYHPSRSDAKMTHFLLFFADVYKGTQEISLFEREEGSDNGDLTLDQCLCAFNSYHLLLASQQDSPLVQELSFVQQIWFPCILLHDCRQRRLCTIENLSRMSIFASRHVQKSANRLFRGIFCHPHFRV